MSALRETITANPGLWLAVGGLVLGLAFGFIVQHTNFCTMGAISDIRAFGDWRRFRAWVLAAVTTLIGAQALENAGVVQLSQSMYLAPRLNWLGHAAGGVMFGFGMVLAGGCASRNLARIGAGDLRSLLALMVMGLFAYMTIGGLIGPIRAALEQATAFDLSGIVGAKLATQSLGEIAGTFGHVGTPAGNLIVTMLIGGGALIFCFADLSFRGSPAHVIAGLGLGLVAVAGWALTGLAVDELADKPVAPISLTFVRPTADTLEWLQRFTAAMMPAFGVATVLGAILGAFLAALMKGTFRLQTFAGIGDTKRNLLGAALMGVGGVMALGCTVGQAITGVSTLALGSFITFAAIVAGALVGLKALERMLEAEI